MKNDLAKRAPQNLRYIIIAKTVKTAPFHPLIIKNSCWFLFVLQNNNFMLWAFQYIGSMYNIMLNIYFHFVLCVCVYVPTYIIIALKGLNYFGKNLTHKIMSAYVIQQ